MLLSLKGKFLLLLLAVAAVSLSSSLFLSRLIIRDFQSYHEGEMEDRVYWVTADLEGTFEQHGGWPRDLLAKDTARALLLGLEIRVRDAGGALVMDSDQALALLPPLTRERVLAVSGPATKGGAYLPYPLFLKGEQVGQLEVRFLDRGKERFFISRANRFLALAALVLGLLAATLGIIAARRLARPITALATAAEAISRGELEQKIPVGGNDELGLLARSFNQMAHSLKLQNALRKKLHANAAHELRTPLAAMRAEVEGMLDGLVPAGREQLQSLNEEIGRLTRIVEGMEDLIQAEASPLNIRKSRILPSQLLQGITERYSPRFREKGVELAVRADKKLAALADPDRLSQIMINLLNNALKATAPGGSVTVAAAAAPDGTLISVADTGRGIAPDDLPHIFERFYRGNEGGLGLGLAIVRELVDAHGGRVEVRSEPGRGSTFTVFLPSS